MMKPQFNMKAKDFYKELAEYAAQLRRMIEAEVDGFSTKTEDILARRKAVSDPKSGFEYLSPIISRTTSSTKPNPSYTNTCSSCCLR